MAELEDAYQAMLRQRAADDRAMLLGGGGAAASSSGGSLGFAPVGAELAGGLLGGGPHPSQLGPGERQRYDSMLRMNGWSGGGGGPPPPLATRLPPPSNPHPTRGAAALAPQQPRRGGDELVAAADTAAAVACLNAPGRWDHMISYTQRNAKAALIAEALCSTLSERGRSVWLDVKMEQLNEAAMKEAAQNSRCILAIISGVERAGDPEDNAYFKRPYCCNELRWALEAGVPVQPVIHADDKQRVGEFLALAPPDLQYLGGVDFIHLDRSRPAYWQVGVDEVIKGADSLASQAAAAGDGAGQGDGMRQRSGAESGGPVGDGVQPEPEPEPAQEPAQEPEQEPQPEPQPDATMQRLLAMGFARQACESALARADGDIRAAAVLLLESPLPQQPLPSAPALQELGQVPAAAAPRRPG